MIFFLRIQQLIVQAQGAMCNPFFQQFVISLWNFMLKKHLNDNKYLLEKFSEGKEWSEISILRCHSSTCNTLSYTKDTHAEYFVIPSYT